MMRRSMLICALVLLSAVFSLHAGEKPLAEPFAENQGKDPGYEFIPGKTSVPCIGPTGEKGMTFDGLKTSVAKLDLKKLGAKLDGFDYSVSLWFRCDGFQDTRNKPLLSGNDIIHGFCVTSPTTVGFWNHVVGPGNNALYHSIPITIGSWNHAVFSYSVHKRILRLQVNGQTVMERCGHGKYFPLNLPHQTFWIGSFKGSIAGLKLYDTVLDPEEALKVTVPEEILTQLDQEIAKLKTAGADKAAQTLTEELNVLRKDPDHIRIAALSALQTKLDMMKQILPGIQKLKNSSIKDAPFVLFPAQTTSPEIRIPTQLPSKPAYSDTFKVTAAGGEVQSVTFFVYPFRDLKEIEFVPGELKNEKGNVLSADKIEMTFVQCWYQSGWNSYFGGTGNYVPSLLLRDPYLLKIDTMNKRNLLRIDYGGKPQYYNITHAGSVLKGPRFQWAFEPVKDAEKLLPCPIEFGQNRQFWADLHVPAGTPPGKYKGRINIKADGADAGFVTLELTVLPFDLPLPVTQYDHSKPYRQTLSSSKQLGNLKKTLKDEKRAWEQVRKHVKNQWDHAICYQAIGFDNGTDDFDKMVQMFREMNLPITYISGLSAIDSQFTTELCGGTKLGEVASPEWGRADKKRMEDYADYVVKKLDELKIPRGCAYFDGIDEAQDAGSLRRQAMYRDIVFQRGMRTHSTGWEDNFSNLPAYETLHDTAAHVDRKNAERWHAINCQIIPYCAPFVGPDNPDLMRRSHGINMYRTNQDGWMELSYDMCCDYHTWNDRYGYDTTYRAFRFIVSTYEGPVINTVAFCGFRDGQNDVRYATLMYQLADECFASGKLENIVAARKAVGWFRDLPYPYEGDLDVLRSQISARIIMLMKQLGKI